MLILEPAVGFEPTTCALRVRCSAPEPRRHVFTELKRILYIKCITCCCQGFQNRWIVLKKGCSRVNWPRAFHSKLCNCSKIFGIIFPVLKVILQSSGPQYRAGYAPLTGSSSRPIKRSLRAHYIKKPLPSGRGFFTWKIILSAQFFQNSRSAPADYRQTPHIVGSDAPHRHQRRRIYHHSRAHRQQRRPVIAPQLN